MEARLLRRLVHQPNLQLEGPEKRNRVATQNILPSESQKRDHEFFEKLAEKEADREMKSQQMMFSMVKEVARSLRESKVHVKLFNMDKYNINSRTTTLFLISFRLY